MRLCSEIACLLPLGLLFVSAPLAAQGGPDDGPRPEQAWASLCALEASLPIARPFDPRQVASPANGAQELAAIEQDLLAVEASIQSSGVPRYRVLLAEADVWNRLALFPWRFGVEPEALPGWPAIETVGEQLLAGFETAYADESWRRSPYEQCLYALLLELSGRRSEAESLVASIEPGRTGCGNCHEARLDAIARARSVVAERHGQLDVAIAYLEDALDSQFADRPELRDDSLLTRYGVLQLVAGRADRAVCVLQRVVDLHPGTVSGGLAREVLAQVGALREPSVERFEALYLAPDAADALRRLALPAVARHGFSGAYACLLEARLRGDDGALEALALLGDERSRRLFELSLHVESIAEVLAALEGLDRLEGGARPYVATALRSLRRLHGTDRHFNGSQLGDALRVICGGGPAVTPSSAEAFVCVWLEWLASHGLDQGGAR